MKRKPPIGLRESRRIWVEILKNFDLMESDHFLLELACRCYDRMEAARKKIDDEGMTILQTDGKKILNPCCIIEKDSRAAFLRAWKSMNLDFEPPLPTGRPPGR